MRNLGVVVAVRNEERSIGKVLHALDDQSLRPVEVVVVNDGSTDQTLVMLERISAEVHFKTSVVTLPYHSKSLVGRPELARVFNSGLKILRERSPPVDYVMILGGDHALPPYYVERIISRMVEDDQLAVASGWITNEPFWENAPRGSSMIVRAQFWESAGKMLFPVNYGWESWVYLRAKQMGYHTRSFKDVPTSISRKTNLLKGVLYGRAMYALGYDWIYAVGRSILVARKSPRASFQMLAGYLGHGGVTRLDVSSYLGAEQRRMILRRAAHMIVGSNR
ncbi:MAG TPA: glycosyltransferase family A protein [Nitrososphaerales archaeon]|nr:glycosyltransferase family A protein [Nitrososphaerales archaeon]